MEGTLSKLTLVTEKGNWKSYDIAFSDGEVIRALLPKGDSRDKEWDEKLKNFNLEDFKGKTINCYMGGSDNATWFVAYRDMLGEKRERKAWSGGNRTSSGGGNKDGYWENKYSYEVDIKDPETALRSLFISVQQFYSAALPNFAKKPKDTIECDALLDEASSKATELFTRMKKWTLEQRGGDDESSEND